MREPQRYLFSAGWFMWAILNIVMAGFIVLMVVKWAMGFCKAIMGISILVTA